MTATSSTARSRSTAPRARCAPSHNRAPATAAARRRTRASAESAPPRSPAPPTSATVPSLAEPAPSTRPRGLRRLIAARRATATPRRRASRKQPRARRTNRSRGAAALEPQPHVPEQMAHAVEEMIQKREGPAEQSTRDRRGSRTARSAPVALLAARERDQPEAEREQSEAQGDAGDPVQDRQGIADLPAIDPEVRRQRPGACGHVLSAMGSVKNQCSGPAAPSRHSASARVLLGRPLRGAAPPAPRAGPSAARKYRSDHRRSATQVKVCQKMRGDNHETRQRPGSGRPAAVRGG